MVSGAPVAGSSSVASLMSLMRTTVRGKVTSKMRGGESPYSGFGAAGGAIGEFEFEAAGLVSTSKSTARPPDGALASLAADDGGGDDRKEEGGGTDEERMACGTGRERALAGLISRSPGSFGSSGFGDAPKG